MVLHKKLYNIHFHYIDYYKAENYMLVYIYYYIRLTIIDDLDRLDHIPHFHLIVHLHIVAGLHYIMLLLFIM